MMPALARGLIVCLFVLSGSSALIAQTVTNLGGRCGAAGGTITRIDKPILGRSWELHSLWNEPLGATAWMLFGTRDPAIRVPGGCTLHTDASIPVLVMRPGSSVRIIKAQVPGNAALVGMEFFVQGFWTATHFSPTLTDGYKLVLGR